MTTFKRIGFVLSIICEADTLDAARTEANEHVKSHEADGLSFMSAHAYRRDGKRVVEVWMGEAE